MYVAATVIGRVNNLQRMIGSWHTLFREQNHSFVYWSRTNYANAC